MPVRLDIETVNQRLLNYPRENYLYIGSFMKSVALAAATAVLLEVLGGFRVHWVRLVPWLASLLAVMVTHLTWNRGTLLTNSRSNLGDVVFPLLLGIDEFCLFGVLSIRLLARDIWHWWFVVVGLHAVLACALVHNRIQTISITEDFDDALRPLADRVLRWVRTDRKETMIGAVLAFGLGLVAFFLLPRWLGEPWYSAVYALLTMPFVCLFAYVSWRADSQRQAIDEYVSRERERNIGAGR